MTPAGPQRELPLYRPFALLAFTTTVAGGTPLGLWALAWLYLGAPAVPIEWILLHAHLQIFGFFATLIPGVAHHLFARFTGRPVTRHPVTRWILGLIGTALVLRLAGTSFRSPETLLGAALLQSAAYLVFAWWVRRTLDPPPLVLLRRNLTIATGWLAAACLLEAGLRLRTLALGPGVPPLGAMRAVHAMALLGGVIGWVLGVLLRAGPMFVPGWQPPQGLARAVPWLLTLAIALVAAGEAEGASAEAGAALARLGEGIALGTVVTVLLGGGALRAARGALPMIARSAEEARIFRLAMASAGVAALGAPGAAAVALSGGPAHLLADALRHLVTVGFLTSVVVAMSFRLIPVLELTALPWPRLRLAAFWALLGAVLLRSAEVLLALGWSAPARLVPLSGLLVWIAVASVGATLVGAILAARRETRARRR